MLKANTGQGSMRYLLQVASIPPYEALSKARDQAPGSKNPLLSTTVNDESGSTSMAMTTTNEHHQIAITTGDSMESLKARALITKELSHDNNESAMKLSMIAAHPMMSTLLREDAGLDIPETSSRAPYSLSDQGVEAYYHRGFYMLVKGYNDRALLDDPQYESLLSWIGNKTYLQKDTEEYKTILESIRHRD